jgi:hypothetical protein
MSNYLRELNTRSAERNDVSYFQNELTNYLPQPFEVVTEPVVILESFMDLVKTASPIDIETRYKTRKVTGRAKSYAAGTGLVKDAPIIGHDAKEFASPLADTYCKVAFSDRDLQASRELQGETIKDELNDAMKTNLLEMNRMATYGSKSLGVPGLLTNGAIEHTETAQDWLNTATTPQQIVDELQGMYNSIRKKSRYTQTPNVCFMSSELEAKISDTIFSTTNNLQQSIKSFIEHDKNIKIIACPELLADNMAEFSEIRKIKKHTIVMCKKKPDTMFMIVAKMFEVLPLQRFGAYHESTCVSTFGGIVTTQAGAMSIKYNKT